MPAASADPSTSFDPARLRGKFIVFDGGEGCGKSTQIKRLEERLTEAGLSVLRVRDPGSTRIGEQIRGVLLNPDHTEMGLRCEMLLYMAARAQMMTQTIRPALETGHVVLSDRFVSSTLAYQLGGENLSADEIRTVAQIALRGRLPDLTLIFDMPVEVSRQRVIAKYEHRDETLFGTETSRLVKDRIEQRPVEYHQMVRQNFLAQAKHDPAGYRVLNADRPIDEVHAEVWRAVCGL
jgi:dTMP kinase